MLNFKSQHACKSAHVNGNTYFVYSISMVVIAVLCVQQQRDKIAISPIKNFETHKAALPILFLFSVPHSICPLIYSHLLFFLRMKTKLIHIHIDKQHQSHKNIKFFDH